MRPISTRRLRSKTQVPQNKTQFSPGFALPDLCDTSDSLTLTADVVSFPRKMTIFQKH